MDSVASSSSALPVMEAVSQPLQPGVMRCDNRPEGDSLPARQERSVKATGLKKRIPSSNHRKELGREEKEDFHYP